MPAKLETLPWLVLSRICEYLDDDDSDDDDHVTDERRSDLQALSLTSRQFCAITESKRFCQLRMTVTNADDDLMHSLERCADMLDRDGGRYRYVQRLKIAGPKPAEVGDEWQRRRSAPGRSDMPRFCRPPPGSAQRSAAKLKSTTGEPWLALAHFIGRLPALKDLVWGFRNMPQPVLAAIHAMGNCRLHMHRFWLDSLVVSRISGHPQVVDIDPHEYMLATSPALYSIVAEVRYYEDTGELNYGQEAIMGMAAARRLTCSTSG